ncbi:MAG: SpoIIE family protein phosphatase [Akkermansiaceae bacterium]|nr:SpoIIE family protein phosphatase [Akkermansiaceae bacterium]
MLDLAYVAAVVLLISWGITLFAWRKTRLRLHKIRKEKDDIVGEEMRMFDFLHHIGGAIERDITPAQLYKEIVEGFEGVLGADAGAIYLLSEDRAYLVPKFISANCPPLVNVPAPVIEKSKTNPRALMSYVMLARTGAEEGLLGQVIATEASMRIESLKGHDLLSASSCLYQGDASAMLSTLQYGGRNIGVVAVIRNHANGSFSDNDYDVFRSVSEQSAFAMGNAMIHQELTEKRKLDDELRTAREVQNVLLPSGEPHIPGYRAYGSNTPARMISGDYFDYIDLPDNRTGIVIADVTGKGLPAGLLMAMCRSVLRLTAKATVSPSEALGLVNRHLFPDVREDMFVSLIYIVLDNDTGKLKMSRAGHDAPILYRSEKDKTETVKPPGLALGIDSGDVFDRVTKDLEIDMHHGDVLLLYTDGVCEAVNDDDDEFGLAKLEQVFCKTAGMGAEKVVESIRREVSVFSGNQPQMDDITMVALERK